jgi:hypothetical protein
MKRDLSEARFAQNGQALARNKKLVGNDLILTHGALLAARGNCAGRALPL